MDRLEGDPEQAPWDAEQDVVHVLPEQEPGSPMHQHLLQAMADGLGREPGFPICATLLLHDIQPIFRPGGHPPPFA